MSFPMKFLTKTLAVLVCLLAMVVVLIWTLGPAMNVPWKSMLQQMSLLPAWLDPAPMTAGQVQGRLSAPEGYAVSLFATGIADARMLRVTSSGDVLVSTPRDGQVVLLEADHNGDGMSDGRRVLMDNLTRPNGIDLWRDYLYVAEEDGIGRIPFDVESGTVAGSYQRIVDELPRGGNHWKKTIRFGPDGLLYVAVGSSCNVCLEEDERRGAILRYSPDGEFLGVFAKGLRNSAGFDWAPASGVLYATDNGRDLLGDDFPPCELNAVVEGGFYGWPFVNGTNVLDPDFGPENQSVADVSIAPVHEFSAHNAPLGIVFLRYQRSPSEYRDTAIVALHGSWNRSKKDGYKVVSLHFSSDGSVEQRDFLTGFLSNDTAIGRPAEVAEGPDGSIYVSDDFASAVYRVSLGEYRELSVPSTDNRLSVGYDPTTVSVEERNLALENGPSVLALENCLTCHGDSEEGDSAQVVLTDLKMRYTINEMVDFLTDPRPPMPPYDADMEKRRELAIYLLETY